MSSCKFQKSAMHTCGSYQFNLGKYQGDLCDVHYWQSQAEQLRQLCKEQHEALRILHPKQSVWRTPTDEQAESIEKAIEKYHSITETINAARNQYHRQ